MQKQCNLYKKPSPEGEPRTWFSHPKMHLGGPLGPLGTKTLPTQPQDLPKPRFCSFVSLLVWFVIDSWCIFPKNARRCWCSFLCVREWTFNETCKWNEKWTPLQKGTVAGLRAALLDIFPSLGIATTKNWILTFIRYTPRSILGFHENLYFYGQET